ncbi:hypothetical protein [Mesorhizobium sp. M8A.F.Ca.ET.165.01.1.1]|uniref:hypothetical protein n=1 Tax=Mesorhizobium sp. M8A.F.Ca.ET.165.01.1.1 TaxID=2563960 RepID=UPI0010939807|nr:hypothetical protein [Mesorhizobium sp. M8A.F.Ca.ET.165.01.1.1]TGT45918.1 hypothetical protein EN808_01020 [Mesorhizobium sp. M8A.F.Ca.ET.165.01.1.1]
MTAKAIDPPTLELNADQLVDWLELAALFDPYRTARVDSLLASLKQLSEEAEENIGEANRGVEQIINEIENEIDLRRHHLGDTYPFRLGDGAEELQIVENWDEPRYSFYLVCLVTSHVTGSPILKIPPSGDLLTRLRNQIFQVLATLAMAGLSGGPAISVGWPRRSGEPIVQLMERAAANGAGFGIRTPPGQYTPPEEKDGGIDVMAWTPEMMPPPSNLLFGQTASGNNWPGKPVSEHARVFENNYLQDIMTGNRGHATIIPFRIWDKRFWQAQNLMHRSLIDRLRLPPHAYKGLQQALHGMMVDEADRVDSVVEWLREYRAAALA